jgi:hypothetical protein
MQQPRDARFVRAFARAPMMTQLTVLARLVVHGERAVIATAKLIDLISLMAAVLSSEARLTIAAQLRDAADMLAPPFDRRALH